MWGERGSAGAGPHGRSQKKCLDNPALYAQHPKIEIVLSWESGCARNQAGQPLFPRRVGKRQPQLPGFPKA